MGVQREIPGQTKRGCGFVDARSQATSGQVRRTGGIRGSIRCVVVGSYQVRLSLPGDGIRRVRLHVSDTGPGLPPEMRERVFQLFTTTKRKGTGLGLAVVRKIVERHGGTVVIEAGEPHGARFVVELPTAQRAMA